MAGLMRHRTATLLWVAVAALGLAALTYPMTYRSELLWSGRQVAGAGTFPPPSCTVVRLFVVLGRRGGEGREREKKKREGEEKPHRHCARDACSAEQTARTPPASVLCSLRCAWSCSRAVIVCLLR